MDRVTGVLVVTAILGILLFISITVVGDVGRKGGEGILGIGGKGGDTTQRELCKAFCGEEERMPAECEQINFVCPGEVLDVSLLQDYQVEPSEDVIEQRSGGIVIRPRIEEGEETIDWHVGPGEKTVTMKILFEWKGPVFLEALDGEDVVARLEISDSDIETAEWPECVDDDCSEEVGSIRSYEDGVAYGFNFTYSGEEGQTKVGIEMNVGGTNTILQRAAADFDIVQIRTTAEWDDRADVEAEEGLVIENVRLRKVR